MANLDTLTAAQVAAGVAAGDFSATEVAKASLYAGESRDPAMEEPKFAMTAVSPDFPKVIPMVSQKGLEGGQEIRYGDCYKTYSCWKKAGAALFDATSA